MSQLKEDKYKDLYASKCEVLNTYKNKAVVKVSESENLIAKKIGQINSGDKVNVFKMPILAKSDEIFIYLSPLYYLFLGFVFGFLLKNDLFHYLLILGLSILGIIQLLVIRNIYQKLPGTKYVAVREK